jgi:hypothetical protein
MWDDTNSIGKVKVTPGDKVTIEVPAWSNCKFDIPTLSQRGDTNLNANSIVTGPASEQLPPAPARSGGLPVVPPAPNPIVTPSPASLAPTIASLDTNLLTAEQLKQLSDFAE